MKLSRLALRVLAVFGCHASNVDVHDWWASWTRMAICTRLATASLVKSRDTWALTVASLMYREVATSALEAPDSTAAATSRSRSVSVPSRWAASRRRSAAGPPPKWVSSVRVTDGEM